ncbi:MAG TPA: MarR family transcriptional regulator [Thermoanaerobaculia bacterium]|nr:MarR family transcriptional regulator [Thermoanaerobaculia bacterium]
MYRMTAVAGGKRGAPTDEDFRSLAEWRYALRRFLAASEEITRSAGVSPTQYQLLLFIRGDPGRAPSIADLAERLQIRHQSAVGLVDRCEAAGLVRRRRDETNRRRVFVTMTRRGASLLEKLAAEHFATIEALGRSFEPPLRAASRGKTGPAAVSGRPRRRS